MNNKKILYFSHKMDFYKSASYQFEFMEELKSQADVYFYGPGYKNYSPEDDLQEILKKISIKPDILFVGHSWLSDKEGNYQEPNPNLNFHQSSIFKCFFFE